MSMVISFKAPAADQTREARRKRTLQQRGVLVTATMILIVAMAALPLPVWEASAQLAGRATELRGWIADAEAEDQVARAFQAASGPAISERVHREVSRWLAPHDRLETTKRLLSMANSTGLVVTRTNVQAEGELLLVEDEGQQDVEVLGASVARASDTTPRVTGTPLPLKADRFRLEGRGKASSLLLFCGVLAAMPVPLRLRSLTWTSDGSDLRFDMTIEKLIAGSVAPVLPEAPPAEELMDA